MANLNIYARTNYVSILPDQVNSLTTYCKLFGHELVDVCGQYAILAHEGSGLACQLNYDEINKTREEIASTYPSAELYREWMERLGVELADTEAGFEIEEPEGVEFDLTVVAKMMAEGEVIVAQTVGHESLRYVMGHAMAANHKGEMCQISLDDIVFLAAKKFGVSEEGLKPEY